MAEEWTPLALERWRADTAHHEALGRCPYAGMPIARCWSSELCDCSMAPPTVCMACGVSVWSMVNHNRAAHA